MSRTAFIDGDYLVYRVAFGHQDDFEFVGGRLARHVDEARARSAFDAEINDLSDIVEADRVVICLSDPDRCFRSDIWPPYKKNRDPDKRPDLYRVLRGHAAQEWKVWQEVNLEGDDLLGMAQDVHKDTEAVIVSVDKDLQTCPSLLYNPMKPERGIVEVDRLDADRYLFCQAIIGDQVDNYPGIPSLGQKSRWVNLINETETVVEMADHLCAAALSKERQIELKRLALGLPVMDWHEWALRQLQVARIARSRHEGNEFLAGRYFKPL